MNNQELFRNVYSDNAFIFMGDFEQAVKDGYRVVDTIPGYPQLQGILKQVKLFKVEQEISVIDTDQQTMLVSEYCPIKFLKQCQQAILSGYVVNLDAPVYDIRLGGGQAHRCSFVRTEDADVAVAEAILKEFDEKRKEQETSKDESDAGTLDVSKEEAPKKRGRKPSN